jgi:hypothetical protein
MSTQTVFKPRSPGNNWGYWKVSNLFDLPAATKRHRKTISFILTAEGVKRQPLTCCHCHQAITEHEDGNSIYGNYNPRAKRAKVWHYRCGWNALLSDIIIDQRANRILAPETIELDR